MSRPGCLVSDAILTRFLVTGKGTTRKVKSQLQKGQQDAEGGTQKAREGAQEVQEQAASAGGGAGVAGGDAECARGAAGSAECSGDAGRQDLWEIQVGARDVSSKPVWGFLELYQMRLLRL